MTFSLHVDSSQFRAHLEHVHTSLLAAHLRLTPVIKGNGYGFGRATLLREATLMGASHVAIGTVWELDQALSEFTGDVHVLEPFNPSDLSAVVEWKRLLGHASDRVILTVSQSHIGGLSGLGASRIFLEGLTSLRRFGIDPNELEPALTALPQGTRIEGLLLHLPIADSVIAHKVTHETAPARPVSGHLRSIIDWLTVYSTLVSKYALTRHLSVSHVSQADLVALVDLFPEYTFEVRMGTSLWLGSSDALRVTGTVLAIHNVDSGLAAGYQQTSSKNKARIAVISGGTSHGVALSAPATPSSMRKRLIALAEGLEQARGKVRSPFILDGKNVMFVEPPHMHVSMVWVDSDSQIAVGDLIECTVRNTIASFDQVTGLH